MAAHPPLFSAEDHARLAGAIRSAEARTSGEIVCVVARQSDGYFFPAAALTLVFLLPASLIVALVLDRFWTSLSLPLFALAQLLGGASLLLLLKFVPKLRLPLTPHRTRFRAAHDNAVRQFLARNVHRTAARTGVLIFVSLAERYAEVIADSGIDDKVPPGTWDNLVSGILQAAHAGELADGLSAAVETAGSLLAQHFPPEPADRNELDDHLVEL